MGNEFRVNTGTALWQSDPDITRFADGSFLIVWDSIVSSDTLDGYYVAGQRYDANGNPVGPEFLIDFVNDGNSRAARVTTLSDGGFAVTFTYSTPLVLDPTNIYVRVFNADGTPRTDAARVDTVPVFESRDPDIVALANGAFMVVFTAETVNNGTKFEEIYGRIYDANGIAAGTDFLINTAFGQYDQIKPETVQLADGNVIVVWHSEGSLPRPGALPSNEIRGTLFSSTGAVLRGDFSIADAFGTVGDGARDFTVGALLNGGFAVTYYDVTLGTNQQRTTFDIKVQLFDATGNATGPAFRALQTPDGIPDHSSVTQLETGEILVVWDVPAGTSFTTYLEDVRGRIFDVNGNALTGEFQIAENLLDDQNFPRIVALSGGGFVVTWQSENIDAQDEGIAARIFGRGTAGNDNATVDVSGTFYGLAGDDSIRGNALANVLNGGDGTDSLWGGAAADRLDGGAGTDYARYDEANWGNIVIRLDTPGLNTGAAAGDTYAGIEGIIGGVGSELISGNAFANLLYGGAGADRIYGQGGNDIVNGGAGSDFLWGGAGADRFVGGDDAGIDYARYDDANWGNLTLRLDNAALNIGAVAVGDRYFGIEGLVGGLGNDRLVGNGGANGLFGGGGNDLIDGASGNDMLSGGAGADWFRFSMALNTAANADRITDFTHGVDKMSLSKPVFAAIGLTLEATELRLGAAAADTNDFLIYNGATGQLFYDADASGTGAQVLFATVSPNTVLGISDFIMA